MTRAMTEDEYDLLVEVGDSFWEKLGILVAEHVAQMPEDLDEVTLSHLQEKCSVYGSNYSKHLAALPRRK